MKPVIELVRRTDGAVKPDAPVEMYACGTCGRLHSPNIYFSGGASALEAALHSAEQCCEPVKCDCGKICEQRYRTACNACIGAREHAKWEAKLTKAKRYTVADAPNDEPWTYGDGEHFAHSLSDLLSDLSGTDMKEDDFPLIAWMCEKVTPQVDVDRFREDFEENLELHTDVRVEDVTTDFDELINNMLTWNKKQTGTIWMPAEDAYVEIQYKDVFDDEKDETDVPVSTVSGKDPSDR